MGPLSTLRALSRRMREVVFLLLLRDFLEWYLLDGRIFLLAVLDLKTLLPCVRLLVLRVEVVTFRPAERLRSRRFRRFNWALRRWPRLRLLILLELFLLVWGYKTLALCNTICDWVLRFLFEFKEVLTAFRRESKQVSRTRSW